MAQAYFCPSCKAAYTAELRGRSCPACGDELIHGRLPSGSKFNLKRSKSPGTGRAVWDVMIKRDPCAYCGCMKSSTVDHIQPKALGGSKGSWTNRAGSCFRCNQDKAHTPLLFFMLEQLGEDIGSLKNDEGNWPIPNGRDDLPREEDAFSPTNLDAHLALRQHARDEDAVHVQTGLNKKS